MESVLVPSYTAVDPQPKSLSQWSKVFMDYPPIGSASGICLGVCICESTYKDLARAQYLRFHHEGKQVDSYYAQKHDEWRAQRATEIQM